MPLELQLTAPRLVECSIATSSNLRTHIISDAIYEALAQNLYEATGDSILF